MEDKITKCHAISTSGGLFAGMLGKALFRWKKGRLKLCLFSLEIGKTGVIVKILINKTACCH